MEELTAAATDTANSVLMRVKTTMARHTICFVSTVAVFNAWALMATGPALAAGSGGGGGGYSAPSESAPKYDPAVEYRKGIAALQAKDFKAAKTAFDRVLLVAPRDANSNLMAGMARAGLDDWKAARKLFEKAVRLDDTSILAHHQLGMAHARVGDRAKAEAQLAALKTKSDTCATTCPQSADLKTAIDAITTALAGAPQARIDAATPLMFATADGGDRAYGAAVSLINEGRYQAAIDDLHQAQTSFGPHPDILTYLGFANRKLGRFDVAETYYRQALTIAPQHRGATEYYGELMVERGDLAGARLKLAELDRQCAFGCYESDELRRWIAAAR